MTEALSEAEKAVLDRLEQASRGLTANHVRKTTGLQDKVVRQALKRLKRDGLVRRRPACEAVTWSAKA